MLQPYEYYFVYSQRETKINETYERIERNKD